MDVNTIPVHRDISPTPLPIQFVPALTHPVEGSYRNTTADNWFSIEFVNEFSKLKLTYVVTTK